MESEKPNTYVGPFARSIVLGLVKNFLNQTEYVDGGRRNRDIPFDEGDSYAWTIKDLLEIEKQLEYPKTSKIQNEVAYEYAEPWGLV